MDRRRIIIFDKIENKIVYDEEANKFGTYHTNLKNIVVIVCPEECYAEEKRVIKEVHKRKSNEKHNRRN